MKSKVEFLAMITIVVAVTLLGRANQAEGVTCNVLELMSCEAAFTSSPPPPPSATCCAKLIEQEPCLCQYAQNPIYASYLNSPQAQKVKADCKVTVQCN